MITNVFILKHSTVIEHFGTLHLPLMTQLSII